VDFRLAKIFIILIKASSFQTRLFIYSDFRFSENLPIIYFAEGELSFREADYHSALPIIILPQADYHSA
jgi:hypothetical protein